VTRANLEHGAGDRTLTAVRHDQKLVDVLRVGDEHRSLGKPSTKRNA
jgi:hypothetical protein